MIHSARFTCVIDANVLYPAYLRDLLFQFAIENLFTIKWSKRIFDECERALRKNGMPPKKIIRLKENMHKAFPDALVSRYDSLIEKVELPDPNDRHVLAAAIKINANVIVTFNLKDFPEKILNQYNLRAIHPDDFLVDIIDLNPTISCEAFRELVLNYKKPPLNEYEVLNILRKNNLKQTADFLHSQL